MKIKTSHDYPPIPTRDADWSAVTDNYDWAPDAKDHPIGRGRTEQDAINDLVEQLVTEAFEDGYDQCGKDAKANPPTSDLHSVEVLRGAVETAVSDFEALELVPGMRHRFSLTVAMLKRALAQTPPLRTCTARTSNPTGRGTGNEETGKAG